ncbi:hypothetical protein IKE_05958 [Bacillus cereus VD196]|uniref:Uncharacterized protein n=1 Tax=Bacillus cereus VD196 TaxID=1053243 RepID=A0A9W5V5V0_BACCE|nr:hypothetical protein IKE_05958 [Bacillus cereus VD196]
MVSLFHFERKKYGIDFVLNKQFNFDINPHYNELIQSLICSICQVLEEYKQFCNSDILLICHIFHNDEVGIVLSEGIETYIDFNIDYTILFANTKSIAEILMLKVN